MAKPTTYTLTDGQTVTTASRKRHLVILDRGHGAHVHTRTDHMETAYSDLVRNTAHGAHGWIVNTGTGEIRHEMWDADAEPVALDVTITDDLTGEWQTTVGNVASVQEGLAAFLRDRGLVADATAGSLADGPGPIVVESRHPITNATEWAYVAEVAS